jgi:hypothetical protein
VIKPWRRTTRKRTVKEARRRIAAAPAEDLLPLANSYLGLFGQASHSQKDRASLARLLLKRGKPVSGALTQTYR